VNTTSSFPTRICTGDGLVLRNDHLVAYISYSGEPPAELLERLESINGEPAPSSSLLRYLQALPSTTSVAVAFLQLEVDVVMVGGVRLSYRDEDRVVRQEDGGPAQLVALPESVLSLVLHSAEAPPEELARRREVVGDLHTLRILPLFLDFDMRELLGALNHFRSEVVLAGEYALQEGDKSESLFVCVSGELEVERGGKVISRIRSGNSFGEMALLNRRPRSASVRAVSDSRLLVLERDDFYRWMNQDALLGAKFLFKLAQDLSLRLDEFYQVADAEDRERRTMKLDVLSPFRRER